MHKIITTVTAIFLASSPIQIIAQGVFNEPTPIMGIQIPSSFTPAEVIRFNTEFEEFRKDLKLKNNPNQILEVKQEEFKKAVTWQDNPFNCNTDTQWIRADNFECLDKPVAKPAPIIQEVQTAQVVIPIVSVAKQANTGSCSLVNNYTDWDTRLMYAICMAESGGNSNAVNWNDNHGVCLGSGGLLQLGCVHFPNYQFTLDPIANIDAGHRVWLQQGYKAWGAYTNGSYAKFY